MLPGMGLFEQYPVLLLIPGIAGAALWDGIKWLSRSRLKRRA